MAITDLTGTTWYVKDNSSATVFRGQLSIIGTVIYNNTEYSITELWIGYSSSGSLNTTKNAIVLTDGSKITVYKSNSFSIKITGGTDATNASLISWLETNGTMLKVADLTNTTWNIPSGWSATAGYGQYNINYTETLRGGHEYNKILIGYKDSSTALANYVTEWNTVTATARWIDDATIEITSGDDVTNPALIAWLSENGELQEETEETKKLTNLTHSTWEFDCANINIDINEFFYINGSLSAGGYSATSALDGCLELHKDWSLSFPNHGSSTPRFYCNVSGEPYLRYYATDGTNFTVDTKCTLYISGGQDVTNTELIEWLYANAKLKSKIISGVWKFKETINLVDNLGASFDFTNHIQPYQTCGAEVDKVMTYNGIDVSSSDIIYHVRQYDIAGEYGSSYQVYSSYASGWQKDAHRLLILVGTIAVTDEFYAWFTANAVEITDGVAQVMYHGRLIGAVEDGEQIKLSCTGDLMITDVKVIAPKTESTIVPTVPDSTTPILKGVWRFKETITATQNVAADTNCKIVGFDHGIYLYINQIYVSVRDNGSADVSYYFQGEDGIITASSYYTPNNGWESEMYRYIYFPTELTVNQAFYDWFIANAEDISDSVTYIKSADEVIGILRSGMTATLSCSGTVAKSYIIVTLNASDEPSVLSFVLGATPVDDGWQGGLTYQFEEGMTWADWCSNTTYNTIGHYVDDDLVIQNDAPAYCIGKEDGATPVLPTDTIISGYHYRWLIRSDISSESAVE